MGFFKLKDFVQIKPDPSYSDLSKGQKVSIIDSLISGSTPRGLLITYDLSHSGRRINNRVYTVAGQKWGIDSLTNPYPKPIIRNHDQSSEPIGRFVSGTYVDGSEPALRYFDNVQEYMEVSAAFDADSPERIYKTLKKYGLLTKKSWPGVGSMRVTAKISDKDAIEKFLDGRYITFSAGSTTDRHVCSVCSEDWASGDICEHRHGKIYDKDLCVFITGKFEVLEGSVVNTPADDLSQITSMEMSDNVEIEDIKSLAIDKTTIYFSDSNFNLGKDDESQEQNKELIQEENCLDEQAKEKEEEEKEDSNGSEEKRIREDLLVDKEYDHMLKIPEAAMKMLHSSGQADVITSSGSQEMTIRLVYENTKEDSFDSLVEDIFADEKKFKVPEGARNNARKALRWKKEHGSAVKGMTPVGWARARQLSSQSEIGLSTVKRMAAFNRHRKNAAVDPKFKSEPWRDRGYVAWLGWGGTTGVDWAIKISAANDSAEISLELDAERSSPEGKGAKTPAKPSEKIKGSKKNKEGSASKGNAKISVGTAEGSLKEKLKAHNAKYGTDKGKRVTLGMLKAVWRRGAGAFSSSHRPNMSRAGWAMARVNAFLKLVRSGRPSNPKYTTDNDLLPAGHPKKSKGNNND
jgi:hypothetical protein